MRYLLLLFISAYSFSQETIQDSIQLNYPTAEYILNDDQKEELFTFITEKDSSQVQQIIIKGYTDFVGSRKYNKRLAKQRVSNVSDFLKSKYNTPIQQLNFGELEKPHNYDTGNGVQEHRKTTIIITSIFKINDSKYTYLHIIDSLKEGDKIRLRNINFKLATANLTKSSVPELEKLVSIMTKNKNLDIAIEGHVCCGADKEVKTQKMTFENEYLSKKRAKTIHNYLISKGIDSIRLQHSGFGFTKPLIYPEESEGDRFQNRRIELSIISNNHLEQLNNIEVNESVILRNISFEWRKAEPTPDSFPEIVNLFKALDNLPDLIVEIQGHVCCGKEEYTTGEKKSHHNYTLSNNRAHNIEKRLISLGIDSTRLSHKGLGFSQPKIFPEVTKEDAHINRRIEVMLVNK
jgi:outer membrane protein OmpA-like peptidoglycan-associated protein